MRIQPEHMPFRHHPWYPEVPELLCWHSSSLLPCSLAGQAFLRLPVRAERGAQQRARTTKVDFGGAGWHLQPLPNLREAQLLPVTQQHHLPPPRREPRDRIQQPALYFMLLRHFLGGGSWVDQAGRRAQLLPPFLPFPPPAGQTPPGPPPGFLDAASAGNAEEPRPPTGLGRA